MPFFVKGMDMAEDSDDDAFPVPNAAKQPLRWDYESKMEQAEERAARVVTSKGSMTGYLREYGYQAPKAGTEEGRKKRRVEGRWSFIWEEQVRGFVDRARRRRPFTTMPIRNPLRGASFSSIATVLAFLVSVLLVTRPDLLTLPLGTNWNCDGALEMGAGVFFMIPSISPPPTHA